MNQCLNERKKGLGFTLVELMVVVAVIAILAAIAYPSYQEYVRKTRRAQARTDLVETVQKLERFYSARNTYVGFPLTSISNTQASLYVVTLASSSATSFSLEAAPQGVQANDRCGTLSINQAGTKGQTGAGMTTADCW